MSRLNPATATRILVATAIAGTALIGTAGTAFAGAPSPSVQAQITQQLRAFPGGTQSGHNEVAYKGGSVKVVIPQPGQRLAPCPNGWYCFYQNKNYGGRRLQFRDCGDSQYFVDYGFRNQTSSWQNRTRHTVEVFDEDVDPWKLLWTMNPGAESIDVGSAADNKADFFTTYCGRRAGR